MYQPSSRNGAMAPLFVGDQKWFLWFTQWLTGHRWMVGPVLCWLIRSLTNGFKQPEDNTRIHFKRTVSWKLMKYSSINNKLGIIEDEKFQMQIFLLEIFRRECCNGLEHVAQEFSNNVTGGWRDLLLHQLHLWSQLPHPRASTAPHTQWTIHARTHSTHTRTHTHIHRWHTGTKQAHKSRT